MNVCLLNGCNFELDLKAQKDLPAGLERRIVQKKSEVDQNPSDKRVALELAELYMEGERWFDAADALALAS
ncbi:MAG: hypothetical protein AAF449_19575, partial [Myxococcota bacterium]